MNGLTRPQRRMLDYIGTFIASKGVSPTYAEMQIALEYRSKASVSRYLNALQARGHITFAPRCARSITLLFPVGGAPHWENIARTLQHENTQLRAHLKRIGWQPDTTPITLPDNKKGKRRVQ